MSHRLYGLGWSSSASWVWPMPYVPYTQPLASTNISCDASGEEWILKSILRLTFYAKIFFHVICITAILQMTSISIHLTHWKQHFGQNGSHFPVLWVKWHSHLPPPHLTVHHIAYSSAMSLLYSFVQAKWHSLFIAIQCTPQKKHRIIDNCIVVLCPTTRPSKDRKLRLLSNKSIMCWARVH